MLKLKNIKFKFTLLKLGFLLKDNKTIDCFELRYITANNTDYIKIFDSVYRNHVRESFF